MKFELKIGELEEAKAEAVLVFAWEEGWTAQKELREILKKEMDKRSFKAEPGKILLVLSSGKIPAEKVVLVGLGKKEQFNALAAQKVFATVAKYLKEEKIASVALTRSDLVSEEFDAIQAAVEGMLLGSYRFSKYKTDKTPASVEPEVTFFVKNARDLVTARESLTRGEVFSQATCFARDLVNEPSSVTTPTYLADLGEKLAKKGKFSCKIYEKDEIAKLGMGALLGVAKGSDEPPKFIKLEYRGGRKKLILAGKGITFDTGGLSLKTPEGMETMKMDMAGAAAILAIFSVLDKIRPKLNLVGLIPATENMPSGKAIKPGDIVKTYSGKTVEVINTDAEGRLILADALAYGLTLKPDLMIDLATLTGACIIALGEKVAGLFTEDEKLKEKILESALTVGEKFWPMPLEVDYKELLKSEVADLKNVTGKKYAGAITAALFLQEFVAKVPWVHLDIAGPAWEEKGTDLNPKGGTGFGVRTILNFLQTL